MWCPPRDGQKMCIRDRELDIGYDSAEQTWEVIVKFVGTTEELETLLFKNFPEEYPRIQLTNLQNEYAVLVLPEHLVEPVAALDKIEYMEKPKLLFFAVDNGKRASCITPVSYTHLDVYKRQVRDNGNGTGE